MNEHGTGALGRWEGDLMRCTGAGEIEGGGDGSGMGGNGGEDENLWAGLKGTTQPP